MIRIKEEYTPFEIEVEKVDGRVVTLKSRALTLKDIISLEKGPVDEEDQDLTSSEKSAKQMVKIFGGKKEDYYDYMPSVLIQILRAYTKSITEDPTKPDK